MAAERIPAMAVDGLVTADDQHRAMVAVIPLPVVTVAEHPMVAVDRTVADRMAVDTADIANDITSFF